jgi:hypothetical protein
MADGNDYVTGTAVGAPVVIIIAGIVGAVAGCGVAFFRTALWAPIRARISQDVNTIIASGDGDGDDDDDDASGTDRPQKQTSFQLLLSPKAAAAAAEAAATAAIARAASRRRKKRKTARDNAAKSFADIKVELAVAAAGGAAQFVNAAASIVAQPAMAAAVLRAAEGSVEGTPAWYPAVAVVCALLSFVPTMVALWFAWPRMSSPTDAPLRNGRRPRKPLPNADGIRLIYRVFHYPVPPLPGAELLPGGLRTAGRRYVCDDGEWKVAMPLHVVDDPSATSSATAEQASYLPPDKASSKTAFIASPSIFPVAAACTLPPSELEPETLAAASDAAAEELLGSPTEDHHLLFPRQPKQLDGDDYPPVDPDELQYVEEASPSPASPHSELAATIDLAGTMDFTGAVDLAGTMDLSGTMNLAGTMDLTGTMNLTGTMDLAATTDLAASTQLEATGSHAVDLGNKFRAEATDSAEEMPTGGAVDLEDTVSALAHGGTSSDAAFAAGAAWREALYREFRGHARLAAQFVVASQALQGFAQAAGEFAPRTLEDGGGDLGAKQSCVASTATQLALMMLSSAILVWTQPHSMRRNFDAEIIPTVLQAGICFPIALLAARRHSVNATIAAGLQAALDASAMLQPMLSIGLALYDATSRVDISAIVAFIRARRAQSGR